MEDVRIVGRRLNMVLVGIGHNVVVILLQIYGSDSERRLH